MFVDLHPSNPEQSVTGQRIYILLELALTCTQ